MPAPILLGDVDGFIRVWDAEIHRVDLLQKFPLSAKSVQVLLDETLISTLADRYEFVSPTVFRSGPYRFFFFSREEKRMHVHVVSGDGEAKYWLTPHIALANNYHYSTKQLKVIESIIEAHHHELISAWKQHFNH